MSLIYSTPIEVRFSDLDLYGHVNSVTFFTFLETARVKLFQDFFRESSRQGVLLVVARAECDYKLPILLQDPVVVTIQIVRTGTSSFDLAYRVHDGSTRVYATAKTTLVTCAAATQTTIPLPDWVRATLAGVSQPEPVPAGG